jgi:hypothetical protein
MRQAHPVTSSVGFRRAAAFLGVAALGLCIVYWPIIRSRMLFVSGDLFDARIMIAMLEHWKNVLELTEDPLTPIYFHPFQFTIAYNDGNMAGGVIYTVLRWLGRDPFSAYELMIWIVRLVGYAAMVGLGMRLFRLSFGWALAAGFVFVVLGNLAQKIQWGQHAFIAFVPLGLYLFVRLYDRLLASPERDARSALAAIGFAFFIFLWAMTAFYSLYTFSLILILFVVIDTILSARRRMEIGVILRRQWPAVSAGVVGLGIAVTGVLLVYRQALTRGHSVETLSHYSGQWFDLFNTGPGTVMWAGLVGTAYEVAKGEPWVPSELTTGFSPVLLGAAAVGLLLAWQRDQRVAALGIATLLIGAMAFKVAGVPLWSVPFQYLPGAQAIRVPARLLLFVAPIVVLFAAYALQSGGRAGAGALMGLVLGLIGLEQLRVNLPYTLNRAEEYAFLRDMPRPPSECRSFYVSVPRLNLAHSPAIDRLYSHSVDAMLLAEWFRLPTVNGMATFTPEGWNLAGPREPDYRARVLAYAAEKRIAEGLCSLDLVERRWGPA